MGKFSDYIDNINKQHELLKKNLTKASNVNCLNMSIGQCAGIIANHISEQLEDDTIGYKRPDWYPDIKTILNNAPNITKDNKTYYPCYIMLFKNTEDIQEFYKKSPSISNVNMGAHAYRVFGGDALLFSDACDNDIANANAESLVITESIEYEWDKTKDVLNPKDFSQGVRWAIAYRASTTTTISCNYGGYSDIIEFVSGNCKMTNSFDYYYGTGNNSIEYVEFQPFTDLSSIANSNSRFFEHCSNLKELNMYNESLTTWNFGSFCTYCTSLTKIIFPPKIRSFGAIAYQAPLINITWPEELTSAGSLFSANKLIKNIVVPSSITKLTGELGADCPKLEQIILPSNLTDIAGIGRNSTNLKEIIWPTVPFSIKGYTLTNCVMDYLEFPINLVNFQSSYDSFNKVKYLKLFKDFNFSIKLGNLARPTKWLKNLCIWLKDRTNDTANTLVIGPYNLMVTEKIYLTFNPNDKRDITWVDAGTEGAINIVQFITEQLNWTLS